MEKDEKDSNWGHAPELYDMMHSRPRGIVKWAVPVMLVVAAIAGAVFLYVYLTLSGNMSVWHPCHTHETECKMFA